MTPSTPRQTKRNSRGKSVAGSPPPHHSVSPPPHHSGSGDDTDTSSFPGDESIFTQRLRDPRLASSSQDAAAGDPSNTTTESSNATIDPNTIPDVPEAVHPAISFAHTDFESKPINFAPNPTSAPTPYLLGEIPSKSLQETLEIANRNWSYSATTLQNAYRTLLNNDFPPDQRARLEQYITELIRQEAHARSFLLRFYPRQDPNWTIAINALQEYIYRS
ncbi:hypothetical protein BGX26_007714 [Mortierella sp. AD094]|nr:hypothetical protein BGX26_007714 [Mortierella sp. AD094]